MGAFGASLRIARRLAARRVARNLLITAMVALPVAGMVAGVTIAQSQVPTRDEYFDAKLGGAEATLLIVGYPGVGLQQYPLEPWSQAAGGLPEPDAEYVTDPAPYLPAGATLVREEFALASVESDTARSIVDVVTGEVWHPALAGRYDLLEGRRPSSPDEVLATPSLLTAFGVGIGGTIRGLDPVEAEWTIVGTLDDRSEPDATVRLFVGPGVFDETDDPIERSTTWYVIGTPLDWDAVKQLNEHGIGALSRAVAAEFPNDHPEPWRQGNANAMVLLAAMIGGFGVLQVAILAGAAFAVGARQEQRLLATLATTGATRGTLMRIVSLGGLVLGAVASLLAVPLGVAAAAGFLALADDGVALSYPGLHVPWPLVAGIALLATAVGWISAAIPARAAARIDVIRALRGARAPGRPPRRVPVAGLVLGGIGTAVTIGGGLLLRRSQEMLRNADVGFDPTVSYVLNGLGTGLAVAGGAGVVLGAVLCGGAVLRLVAALLHRTGPAARIASRDLLRNRGRSVPAIAASLVAAFTFALIASAIHTTVEASRASYQHQQAPDQARLSLADVDWERGDVRWADAAEQRRAVTALEESLPAEEVRVIDGVVEYFDFGFGGAIPLDEAETDADPPAVALPRLEPPRDNLCPLEVHGSGEHTYYEPAPAAELADADPRCARPGFLNIGGVGSPRMQVGSAADLELLLGEPLDAGTRAALARDEPIVLMPYFLGTDDRIRIAWYDLPRREGQAWTPVRVETPTAHLLPPQDPIVWNGVFLTPAAAADLGLEVRAMNVVAQLSRQPTDAERFAAHREAAIALGTTSVNLQVEAGPPTVDAVITWSLLLAAAVVTLAAVLAALGLARVEGRQDDVTLAAVGASRGIRRAIAFVQAVVIIGAGGMLGTVASLIPLAAMALGTAAFGFTPPWLQLAVLALGLPVVVGVVAALVVRVPAAPRRRVAIA